MSPLPSLPRLRLASLATAGACVTVILTVLPLLLLVDHYAVDYARREAQRHLQQLSWQMRASLDDVVRKAGADAQLLAQLPQLREAGDVATVRATLVSLQKSFPDYAWIGLANADGKVYAATGGLLEGSDVSARPWFKAGQRDRLIAGDYHPALLLDKKLPPAADPWRFVDVSLPVQYADGSYRGVLGLHLSWNWARRQAASLLAPLSKQYGVEIFVVRADGTVLLGPAGMEEQRIASPSLTLAQAGQPGALGERWNDGRHYLTGYARTGQPTDPASLQWSVLVRQPEHLAMADAHALERRILLLGAALGALAALSAALLARRLARPISRLSAHIEQRTAWSDAAPPPPVPVLRGFREVQVLSRALAGLIRRDEQQRHALETLNDQLEATVAARTAELVGKASQLETALARQQLTQRQLQDNAAELRAILDNAHDAFFALDPIGAIVDWNPQAERLLGWRRDEALGQPLDAVLGAPVLSQVYDGDMAQLAQGGAIAARRLEVTVRDRAGAAFPVEASIAYVPRERGHLLIAFLHDISERRHRLAALEQQALRDPLTGLANRRALMIALPEALARAARQRRHCAVLFVDLDGFKQINDRHGHEEGDELLRQLALRLIHAMRQTDTVARLAGDEFVVIVEALHGEGDAGLAADKLLLALNQPFALNTTTVTLSASIGVALHGPADASDVGALLERADAAMYAAKQRGKNCRVISAAALAESA